MDGQAYDQDSIKQLETMLQRIDKGGLKKLSSEDVLAFGQLYRRAVSALSSARSQGVDDAGIDYLNRLVARAYGHIYTAEARSRPRVGRFFTTEFPQSFRRNLPFILAAFIVFMGAALFAFAQVRHDPGRADIVLGPQASAAIDEISARHTGHRNWMPGEKRPVMSSFVITNNLWVSAVAFSTGIGAGILTLVILFQNGLMLGTIGAAVSERGHHIALGFWSFVAPHGVIELTAIFIAGGAGLMLGWALLSPGDYTRGAAIKMAGREAFKLILGLAVMLGIAGLIEGFFSPSMVPDHLKLTAAGIIAVLQFAYLFLAGRNSTAGSR